MFRMCTWRGPKGPGVSWKVWQDGASGPGSPVQPPRQKTRPGPLFEGPGLDRKTCNPTTRYNPSTRYRSFFSKFDLTEIPVLWLPLWRFRQGLATDPPQLTGFLRDSARISGDFRITPGDRPWGFAVWDSVLQQTRLAPVQIPAATARTAVIRYCRRARVFIQ